METFKIFLNNEEREFYFKQPTHKDILAIDMEYRKGYSNAIREGVMSEAEAKKLAEKQGAWTKEEELVLSQVTLQISLLESIVKNEDNKRSIEEIRKAAKDLSAKRSDMIEMISRKVDITSRSAEGYANQQKIHKLIELCCVEKTKEGDIRLFNGRKDYEEFVENNPDVLSQIVRNAYYFEYGDPEKMSKEWPEYKFLQEEIKQEVAKTEVEKSNINSEEVK